MVDAQDVFAAVLPVKAALVAAEAVEADTTSEDVVNRHPAFKNKNEVSPCAGRVCCGCSLFLALPAMLVVTSPTADKSSTSGLTPLRRLNHCMTLRALIVDTGLSLDECASLRLMLGKMGLRRRRRCTRRRGGCGRNGDGCSTSERDLGGVSPVGVFPFWFLIVRLNSSTMTVSVFCLFLSLVTSLGVGLSSEVFDWDWGTVPSKSCTRSCPTETGISGKQFLDHLGLRRKLSLAAWRHGSTRQSHFLSCHRI